MDGRTDGRTDGQTDRQTDRQTASLTHNLRQSSGHHDWIAHTGCHLEAERLPQYGQTDLQDPFVKLSTENKGDTEYP